MAAFRAIHVIQGRPTLSAAVMRAVVQSAGHMIRVVESSPKKVIVEGARKGTDDVQSATWTIERAKNAGLTGKDTWRAYPEEMLTARATAQVARLIAADLLHGIYSREEMDDEPAPMRREPVRRAKPEQPPPPEPEIEPDEAVDGITGAQVKKLGVLMNRAGLTDRGEALEFVSGFIGRVVSSRNELSKDEASRLIDQLENAEQAAAEPEPAFDEGDAQ